MDAGIDDGMDAGVDSRWLSYAELAELRRIDKPSALKLALRHKWPRRKDNHGRMQVCVPSEWLAPQDTAMDRAVDVSMHVSTALAAYQDAKAAFGEALKAANARADEAIARVDRLTTEIAEGNARTDRLTVQLAEAGQRADRAEARAGKAEERAEAMEREETARQARGRLRRAWDGWRGR